MRIATFSETPYQGHRVTRYHGRGVTHADDTRLDSANMSTSTTNAQADIKDSILDTIGETPLVRLSRIGAGAAPQIVAKIEYFNSGRLDQGPRRDSPRRGGRARRPAATRRHDHRADLRQHRHRPGDRRPPEGLSRDRGDAGQDVQGEDRPPARVRRRGRGRADRRVAGLAAVLLPRRRPPDRGDPRRVPAQPVREPGQPGDALPDDRARAVAPVRRRDHALRVRRRHRRHDHRRGPVPQGAEPRRRGHRGRPRRLHLLQRRGAPVPRRGRRGGLLAVDVRPERGRPLRDRVRPRQLPHHAPARRRRGPARRRLAAVLPSTRRCRSRSGSTTRTRWSP